MRECFLTALDHIDRMNQLVETRLHQNQAVQNALEQGRLDQLHQLSDDMNQTANAMYDLLSRLSSVCIESIYESGHQAWSRVAASIRMEPVSLVHSQVACAMLIYDVALESSAEITSDDREVLKGTGEVDHETLIFLRRTLDTLRTQIQAFLKQTGQ